VLVLAAAAAAAPAVAADHPPSTLTGKQVTATRDGQYKIQNDVWGASAAASVVTDRGKNFTVSRPFRSNPTDGVPSG
jgi:hypothetical protein